MKQLYRIYWDGCDCITYFEGDIWETMGEVIEELIYAIENGVCADCKNIRVSISKIFVKDNEKDYTNYDRELELFIYGYEKRRKKEKKGENMKLNKKENK